MILKLEQNEAKKDIEILISYPEKNKTVERIVSLVKSAGIRIECFSENSVKMVNVADIYYIESIDKKTIVSCENDNFFVKSRLYQIYGKLKNSGFIQISKYCILNINKLEEIKPLSNSRLEAVLSNGKFLYVTRKYLEDIKKVLLEEK